MGEKPLLNLIPYFGGKTLMAEWIISYFPPHVIYVEVFGGSGAVLLNKPPSEIEVYNDIDENLVSLFRVLQDKEKSQILFRKLKYTLFSRAELYRAKMILKEPQKFSDIDRAWAVYITCRLSYGAKLYSPSFAISIHAGRDKAETYYESLKNLVIIKKRLEKVHIENLDWRDCMERYDTKDTLFYLDPPYALETAPFGKVYYHTDGFLKLEEHKEFLEYIRNVKGMVILSGFDNELYNKILFDWGKVSKDSSQSMGACLKAKLQKYKNGLNLNYQNRARILWINPLALKRGIQLKLEI